MKTKTHRIIKMFARVKYCANIGYMILGGLPLAYLTSRELSSNLTEHGVSVPAVAILAGILTTFVTVGWLYIKLGGLETEQEITFSHTPQIRELLKENKRL